MDYTIGRLAKAAGVHVETIRYYQRRGLLSEPSRTTGAFRHYTKADEERLCFIKRAQNTGFTLAEIETLLTLRESDSCADSRALAVKKLSLIEERLSDLRRLRRELKEWVDTCDRNPAHAPCPAIRQLAQ